MSGINQIALSLIRRNAPYRGPRTSDSWNDTIDEISTDLASVISEWNLKLYPLLLGVPDGTDDVNIDAFTNGLDGSQLYVDHDSTESDDNGAYWNETYSRPITLKESLTEVREEMESNYNDLAALVAEASGALTHDQKRAIGLEIFSDDYTFGGVSILTRSQNNEYNIVQLAKDIYGSSFSLDSDGIANFTNSINDALDAILTLHQGTWDTDITLVHDIVNADVNVNADIDQAKLAKSGGLLNADYDISGNPPDSILDDLNIIRTVIKTMKGLGAWEGSISEPYTGGPVDLNGHMTDFGILGEGFANNPHGLSFIDIQGTDIEYIRSVLGITDEHQQPPYAAYPPEGSELIYIEVGDSLTEAVAKLDDALEGVSLGAGTHASRTDNPHFVTATQIGHVAISAEINANSSEIEWDNIDKTGSSIADLISHSHTLLTDIGSNTHADIDSALTVLGTENTNSLRTDVDSLLGSSFLEASDITYSFLDSAVGFGTTANTICAGDDSRLGGGAPEDHGNEVHTSSFIDVTHIQGSGSAPPSSGEHYAADVYVEDSAGNFSNNDVEQVLADIYGGSVKTSSTDDIHARHNFVSGEDFTMDPVVNPNHKDLVVDDLKHTDIVAPATTDIQHTELIVDDVNVIDITVTDGADLTDFEIGETATQLNTAAEGQIVFVDAANDLFTVRVTLGTFSDTTADTITAPPGTGGPAVPAAVSPEFNAYAIDETVTATGGSDAIGTIIYIDETIDTIWIEPTSGTFLDTDVVDNGDLGYADIDTLGVTSLVDTYKPLDIITTDTGATAEVIDTDDAGVLIRVRDLVGTVTAADVVSNPRSPIEFTVDSSSDREFAVDDSITGTPSTATGTIEKIDVPNKTLRILEVTGTFTAADRIDNGASNTETEIDTMPAVTSSYYVGDIVTGSVSTETGVVTAITGSIVSVGDRSGTFNASDFLRTNTTNYLGNSQFTSSLAQAPFTVDTAGTALVDNLNADLLDGLEGSEYGALAVNNTWTKAQAVSQVTLTDAATITVDASLSNVFSVTLGGNRTLGNPTNLISGGTYIIHIDQDGTPPRTLAYDTLYKFPGGTTPVLSTTANAKDTLTCIYDGTILRCAMQLDFK